MFVAACGRRVSCVSRRRRRPVACHWPRSLGTNSLWGTKKMAVESIGIIGVGNVGQALLFGWLGTATLQASQFIITNGPEYSCDDVLRQAQALGFSGIKATSDVAEVIRNAQVVILSSVFSSAI